MVLNSCRRSGNVSIAVALALAVCAVLSLPVELRAQCEDVELHLSQADIGWHGLAHTRPTGDPRVLTLTVVSRCSDDSSPCTVDTDCTAGTCDATCDPLSGAGLCELGLPDGPKRCVRSLAICVDDQDCAPAGSCERMPAPPIPLAATGTPICVTSLLAGDATGTLDPADGHSDVSMSMRWRVHLGITLEAPCPRCGAPGDDPQPGQTFVCDGQGSPNDGQSCTVDAVHPLFGGTSFDCPPHAGANVSVSGVAVLGRRVTTRTATQQAVLPCAFPLSQAHPDSVAAVCMDDFSQCSTNSDCLRCTNDLSPCGGNTDCAVGASCAAAPDQPVSCGVYCHCGYCDQDPDAPCFTDDDCSAGQSCAPGAGGSEPMQQVQHNGCANLICGETALEECCSDSGCMNSTVFGTTALVGQCSLAPYRECANDSQCSVTGSGVCEFAPRECFGGRIQRTGRSSAPGLACIDDAGTPACTTNADCSSGECSGVCASPTYVALSCMPPTASAAVNAAFGIPGPVALHFNGVGRAGETAICGNSITEIGESCDDGNVTGGDGCNSECQDEGCIAATPGYPAVPLCSDGMSCTIDSCDALTSSCVHDVACTDLVGCTVDGCGVDGNCESIPDDALCEDGDPCTDDSCSTFMGCTQSFNTGPCDDGVDCTTVDLCDLGTCRGSSVCALDEHCEPISGTCMPGTTTTSVTTTTDVTNTTPTTMHQTTTTLYPPGVCGDAPRTGCLVAEKLSLRVLDHDAADAKDRLRWKWRLGDALDAAELGDPASTTQYRVCVYDSLTGQASLEATLEPAVGSAWRFRGDRAVLYVDGAGSSSGVRRLRIAAGPPGQSSALIVAKGADLPTPEPAGGGLYFFQDPDVTVQLISTEGICLTSVFDRASTTKNNGKVFRATD